MANDISVKRATDFVDAIFGEDMHAARVKALGEVTAALFLSVAVGLHSIGRAVALAKGHDYSRKSGVKKVDLLVGNEKLDVWALFADWVPFVVAQRTEIVVALDWTHFEKDAQSTIAATLMTSHGRGTPLVWLTVDDDEKDGQTIHVEQVLLSRLREVLPHTVERVIVLADRGFADTARWDGLRELGFDFVIRIRGNTKVADSKGALKSADEWVGPGGVTRTLKDARVTGEASVIQAFVAVRKTGMKDSWCLVSSLGERNGAELVALYAKRFTIEESFRDIKDLRFGLGLASVRTAQKARRDRFFLLSALAIAMLTLLGAAGEATGLDRRFRTNTAKKRQYSLFRQGCDYFEFLPGMSDKYALPLLKKFGELLREHRIFAAAFGVL